MEALAAASTSTFSWHQRSCPPSGLTPQRAPLHHRRVISDSTIEEAKTRVRKFTGRGGPVADSAVNRR